MARQNLARVQCKLLQVDGVTEEGQRGRYHRAEWVNHRRILDDIDFEGTEEREWSRIDVGELSNVHPVVVHEVEGPNLLSVGRKQCHGAG